MPRTRVSTLIDTRVWVLALRAPALPADSPLADAANRAAELASTCIDRDLVLFTPQLVAEIHHVAMSRVRPRPLATAVVDYLSGLLSLRNARLRAATRRDVADALALSTQSGIHIWDYLVVLPWRGRVDRIVSMDPHYRHPHFAQIASLENPLGIWRSEGQPLP
ncbi:MAG: hypothetical protein HYY06_30430 [Deltaproteobacteria bacterium]|nr:hypothetical protein [Deltaproteobacteria bacterium]